MLAEAPAGALAPPGEQELGWIIHTEVFDGPLDLLLYLVKRDGVDLRTLKVSSIADAYLAFVERMRELHLGVAAEYLVMAATLCYLKSLELLPRPPTVADEEEEGQDPREVLRQQLIAYQRYRESADFLDARPQVGRDTWVREPEIIDDDRLPVSSRIDAFGLLDVYYGLITREATEEPTHTILEPGVDFDACCRNVLSVLSSQGGKGELGAILAGFLRRSERVVSFIAALEMAKLGWLDLVQREHAGPVAVTLKVDPSVDLGVMAGALGPA